MGVIYIKIGFLSTGDELIEGDITNITVKELSQKLNQLGYNITYHINVADNIENIINGLKFLVQQKNNIIIITGGLGSTEDDLTREAVAKFLNKDLKYDEKLCTTIQERYKKAGKSINPLLKKQAYIIDNAKILPNELGSAPGQLIKEKDIYYIILPGPPKEAINIFNNHLINFFLQFKTTPRNFTKIQFHGITESNLMSILEKELKDIKYSTKLNLSIGPSVIIKEDNEAIIDKIHKNKKIKDYIIPENPALHLYNKLKELKQTISFAESCTGGLLSKIITDIPGSSMVFKGAIIAYSNEIKENILDINSLEKYGAVSKETVEQMAKNVSSKFNTDYAISISGIAGPGGGTPEKPVGTVWFGFYSKNKDLILSEKHFFSGDRETIREKAVYYSIIRFIKIFL
ncbi:competence/damage-inducible protein CinA-like protein [Marinitoga piezophila KA3]|uniref:CinA-like protein n=1 Tax=Marinitoga piezophila (strain DSM 14283 / JCM 11233 / KA3) TaxID=443254 RepID=H2J6G3_MARPK|nr:nicotinamide-nucleotide amidohydrolase family protein [Marinitoga piezophila]AEX85148.1 competence/damage-inducible protein CinA-like protein [Marinitoga piezophila KA3]